MTQIARYSISGTYSSKVASDVCSLDDVRRERMSRERDNEHRHLEQDAEQRPSPTEQHWQPQYASHGLSEQVRDCIHHT